jgi:hypothetical protein
VRYRGDCEGIDGAQLVQRHRLVPPGLVLPGQVERLVRTLPGLRAMSRQATDFAEPCQVPGTIPHPTGADTLADPLLQPPAPLPEAALERSGMAQARQHPSQQLPFA